MLPLILNAIAGTVLTGSRFHTLKTKLVIPYVSRDAASRDLFA